MPGHADAADADEMDGAEFRRQFHEGLPLFCEACSQHGLGEPLGGIRDAGALGRGGGPGQAVGIVEEPADRGGEALGGELRLRHHEGRADCGENPRVRRLVLVEGAGQRHQDRGSPDHREFRDRRCARPGDDEMGVGHAARHVLEEGLHLHADGEARIVRADAQQILLSSLLGDDELRIELLRQPLDRRRHDVAHHAGALAAAEDEKTHLAALEHRRIADLRRFEDRGADRIAGVDDPAPRRCRDTGHGGKARRDHARPSGRGAGWRAP